MIYRAFRTSQVVGNGSWLNHHSSTLLILMASCIRIIISWVFEIIPLRAVGSKYDPLNQPGFLFAARCLPPRDLANQRKRGANPTKVHLIAVHRSIYTEIRTLYINMLPNTT